jgi:hypothetical protein
VPDRARAQRAADSLAGALAWTSDGWTQHVAQYPGHGAGERRWPGLMIRRFPEAQGNESSDDARTFVRIIPKDPGSLQAYVGAFEAFESPRGTATRIWEAFRDAAPGHGITGFQLEARDIGGWFWAKQGFDFVRPHVEARDLATHLEARAAQLAGIGYPMPDDFTESLSNGHARASLAAHGLQKFREQIPTLRIPRISPGGQPTTEFVSAEATLIVDSNWHGVLRL